MTEPQSWARHGPLAEDRCGQLVFALQVMEARPRPPFCPRTEVGSQSIALAVPAIRQEVFVFLDRERLESSLIEMPRPHRSVVSVPALRER